MEKTYTIELTEKEVRRIRLALAFRFDDLAEEGRDEKAREYDQLHRRFVELTKEEDIDAEEVKTTTTTATQYAAMVEQPDGSWYKVHPFTARSKAEAEKVIQEHRSSRKAGTHYKVVARNVTTETEEWQDLEEVTA